MSVNLLSKEWYVIVSKGNLMDGPIEYEKVLIKLYPAKEAILKLVETKLQTASQTLLIFDGIPNSEFSKQKQSHLLGTMLRILDYNLSRL
jgi:hypothetical protein